MNPLCVFFAMFAALSLVRNIIERRKRAQLLRLLVAALRAHRQAERPTGKAGA